MDRSQSFNDVTSSTDMLVCSGCVVGFTNWLATGARAANCSVCSESFSELGEKFRSNIGSESPCDAEKVPNSQRMKDKLAQRVGSKSPDQYSMNLLVVNYGTGEKYCCSICEGYLAYDTLYCEEIKIRSKVKRIHFECLDDKQKKYLAIKDERLDRAHWKAAGFADKHVDTIMAALSDVHKHFDTSQDTKKPSPRSSVQDGARRTLRSVKAVAEKCHSDTSENTKKPSPRSLIQDGARRTLRSVKPVAEKCESSPEVHSRESSPSFPTPYRYRSSSELAEEDRPMADHHLHQTATLSDMRELPLEHERSAISGTRVNRWSPTRTPYKSVSVSGLITDHGSQSSQGTSGTLVVHGPPKTPVNRCAQSEEFLASVKESTRERFANNRSKRLDPFAARPPPAWACPVPTSAKVAPRHPVSRHQSQSCEFSESRRSSGKLKRTTLDDYIMNAEANPAPPTKIRKVSTLPISSHTAQGARGTNDRVQSTSSSHNGSEKYVAKGDQSLKQPQSSARNSLIYSPVLGLARRKLPQTPRRSAVPLLSPFKPSCSATKPLSRERLD